MKNILLTLLIMVFITGCKEKKVDSSSDEKFTKSLEAVVISLNAEKKKSFEDAIEIIVLSGIGNIFQASVDPNGIQRRFKAQLDEKTADEIIAYANRINAERQEEERKAAIEMAEREAQRTKAKQEEELKQAAIEIVETQKKIAELEAKKKKAELDKEELKKLKVLRSQFYFQKDIFMEKPVIQLEVKNETTYAISCAYFVGVLATPGRSVPWVKSSINYKIPGGLEPGEHAIWRLAPNMFGDWGDTPKDRNDMVLTVTVRSIEGADEKAIFDSEFSQLDELQLQELSERLEELKKILGK